MDCNTGKIYTLTEKEASAFAEAKGRALVALTETQHERLKPMGEPKRKNYMRNQPCVCGSGKKFKRCCWGLFA